MDELLRSCKHGWGKMFKKFELFEKLNMIAFRNLAPRTSHLPTFLDVAAHLSFFALFVMSAIVCERGVFGQSALQIFDLINTRNFVFTNYQYSLVFTQWLPLVFIRFNASLKTVLIAYSLAPIVLNYIIFLLIRYKFKDVLFAYLPLLVIVCMRFSFWDAALLMWTACSFFSLFYVWIEKQRILENRTISTYFTAFIFVLILLGFYPFGKSPMLEVKSVFYSLGLHFNSGLYFVIKSVMTSMLIPFLLTAYLGYMLFIRKHYKTLLLWIGAAFVWLLFCYKQAGSIAEMEALTLPYTFVCMFIFVFKFVKNKENLSHFSFLLIFAFMLTGVVNAGKAMYKLRERNLYIEKFYDYYSKQFPEQQKWFFDEDEFAVERTIDARYLGVESILYTTLKHQQTTQYYFSGNVPKEQDLTPETLILTSNREISQAALNLHYFNIPEQSYTTDSNHFIRRVLYYFCDVEKIVHPWDGVYFEMEGNPDAKFGDPQCYSDERAYQGRASCKTTVGDKAFGMTIHVPVEFHDHIVASAWRYGSPEAVVGMQKYKNAKAYYVDQRYASKQENGWEFVELNTHIPVGIPLVTLFCWNINSKDSAYFDNFSIEVFREK